MKIDEYGRVFRTEQELIDILYQDPNIDFSKINLPNKEQFLNSTRACGIQYELMGETYYDNSAVFDDINQHNWFMPDEYKNMDIESFLVNECPKENYERLIEELTAFRDKDMLNLLKWCKYFVDTCRFNNIVWGVGRGSSVASYVLYLIGVHKVDSIKYNLDFAEFMR
jgi:DNA polymerase III alpha subunit